MTAETYARCACLCLQATQSSSWLFVASVDNNEDVCVSRGDEWGDNTSFWIYLNNNFLNTFLHIVLNHSIRWTTSSAPLLLREGHLLLINPAQVNNQPRPSPSVARCQLRLNIHVELTFIDINVTSYMDEASMPHISINYADYYC